MPKKTTNNQRTLIKVKSVIGFVRIVVGLGHLNEGFLFGNKKI
jgi:hypothetical protein